MKASYDNPEQFGKLTLEITDRQEADVLWHVLNMPDVILRDSWKRYSAVHNVPDLDVYLIVSRLWNDFDNVYHPQSTR